LGSEKVHHLQGYTMSIVLASTGYPQRELPHLQRLLPKLTEFYETIILSIPPDVPPKELEILESLSKVLVVVNQDWSQGRFSAIQKALSTSAEYMQYADLDRLLYWVDIEPTEWREAVPQIMKTDCLIIGRTEKAIETHPKAIQQTERIVNTFFSYILGKPVDLGGGSRGFSRKAAEFLMENCKASCSWCTDSEWVMMLCKSGFQVETIPVDGLASPNYDANYDMDAENWAFRTKMAFDIIQAGMAVIK
jgi:hypothetical protein